MLNASLGYDDGLYYGSFGGKYVSSFYGDLTNDEKIGGRTVFDVAAGVHLPVDKRLSKAPPCALASITCSINST